MILVSGFEAFGGEAVNPTQLLISALDVELARDPAKRERVATVLLPVGFANAFTTLEDAIRRYRPTTVVALGQAGGRAHVELERIAVNLKDADIPDNDGIQPRDEAIDQHDREAYISTLPLRELENALTQANVPVRISNTAGLYVCNYLFYRLQQLAQKGGLLQSGFIHFPYLPEQAARAKRDVDGALKPSMEFASMQIALEKILATLL